MSMSVGIVGAGIVGRLLAFKCALRGWKVSLFERGDESGSSSCSHVAAGMLAPFCELDVSEKIISELGIASLKLWPTILHELEQPVFFQQQGSLVVAHPTDQSNIDQFKRNVATKAGADVFQDIGTTDIATLEPHLDRCFKTGLYFPSEGQIDNRASMAALLSTLKNRGLDLYFNRDIQKLLPHQIMCGNEITSFDMVLDCRGLGAAPDLPDLRAVRGELIRVYAPDVSINRPIRFIHPRWPIYIVPRPNGHCIIGATSIESEDNSPISVRSTLELLSAAFALHSGFGEARIVETSVGLRPAFPDNQPRITHQKGLIRINGLYRHGFLCAPKMADIVCDLIENAKPEVEFTSLFQEAA